MAEYSFAVGSLKFKDFGDLYKNIEGRTTGFSKKCHILNGEDTVVSFDLAYEKTPNHHRFVFVWEPQMFMVFGNNAELTAQLKKNLPKFKRIGSLAAGGAGPQKFYGYLNIADLV